jgi:hypothetical protein
MPEVSRFLDKFDRTDGPIGSNYTEACGSVEIFDEAAWPVEVQVDQSPQILSPDSNRKVQVLYSGADLDGPNYAARAVWFHVGELPGIQPIDELLVQTGTDPSFTILARMSKDPQLVDLAASRVGGSDRSYAFEPECYDQGYGLRVTCPRDGSAPILKIIKLAPPVYGPGISAPQTAAEPDKAFVLASMTLEAKHLHVGVTDDVTTYKDHNQWMRLRIRRSDTVVVLEAYLNDRNQHVPILTAEDRRNPLWGVVGFSGFEFLNATLVNQPAGTSPFSLRGLPVMACQLFEVETVKDFSAPSVSVPENRYTYQRLAERVALLIEKDGDTVFTATVRSQARLNAYLDFVYESEMSLLRLEGYWWFLERHADIFTRQGVAAYDLPENASLVYSLTRQNEPRRPIEIVTQEQANLYLNPDTQGDVKAAVIRQSDVNDRFTAHLTPVPSTDDQTLRLHYYARWIRPYEPALQIPLIPQEHIDVLIYDAAAHAILHNTDAEDTMGFGKQADMLRAELVRVNNRKMGRRTIFRTARSMAISMDSPLTRASQLGHFLR